MTRINVYSSPEDGYSEQELLGWFDDAKAARWSDADFNGDGSGGTGRGQAVNRTAGGRWVLEHWTRWQGEAGRYEFIEPDQARAWLLRNNEDSAVAEHFGEIEEERGPGRPEVGGRITTSLGDELLAEVDAYRAEHGQSRAEAIREAARLLVSAGSKEA